MMIRDPECNCPTADHSPANWRCPANPLVARWTAALRSGEYKQGKGRLRKVNDEFCCLGVLCDLVAPEEWEPQFSSGYLYHKEAESSSLPSESFMRHCGLENLPFNHLAYRNDDGATFEEIARVIEKWAEDKRGAKE